MGTEIAIILIISAIVAVVAAAASAYMQYQSGQQQKKMADYNVKVMERKAETDRQLAEAKAEDIRRRKRALIGQEEALIGGSNVVNAPGTSPLEALSYSAKETEKDALRVLWTGNESANTRFAEARMEQFRGQNAAYSGTMSAGTTLLSGVSAAGRTYAGAYASQPTQTPMSGADAWGQSS